MAIKKVPKTNRGEIKEYVDLHREIIDMIDNLSKKKVISHIDKDSSDYYFMTFNLYGGNFRIAFCSGYRQIRFEKKCLGSDDYYDEVPFSEIFDDLTPKQKKEFSFYIALIDSVEAK